MKFVPHDYQRYAIERMITDPSIGLFLDMGLGKTVITLTAINDLRYNRWAVARCLVVAPKKVAEATWTKEAQKWDHLQHLRIVPVIGTAQQRIKALFSPGDVWVISRDNLPWLCDYLRQSWRFDMVVLDESTSFKNSQSKRFKALKMVRSRISRVVALTGTPSPNGLMDLWAQVYLLDGGERLGKTITSYRENFFTQDYVRPGQQYRTYTAQPDAQDRIQAAISDICVSMKASDYEQAMNDLAGTLEPARFAVLQTISDFIEENGETLEQWGQIILFVVSTIVEMLEMLASLPPSVTIIITTIILAITIFTKVNKAINDGTGAIGQLAGAFRAANPSLMQTAMIVMMVVAAVSLLVYLLVALTEGAERASSTMDAFAKRSQSTASTVSSAVNTAKSHGKQNGFARGTASAPRGRFLVGENGPEEIELRGGERIYSATQSRARRALATGGGSGGVVNNYYNLDVSKVRSMAQVVELAESAQQYNRKYGR